jgi:hypothetical protein
MIGLYILPWQDMKWCQDNGSLIVLDWETRYVLACFSDVDWDEGSMSMWSCWDSVSRSKTSLDHGPGGAGESDSCIWCTRAHRVFEFGLCRQAWLKTQFPVQDASSCGQYIFSQHNRSLSEIPLVAEKADRTMSTPKTCAA